MISMNFLKSKPEAEGVNQIWGQIPENQKMTNHVCKDTWSNKQLMCEKFIKEQYAKERCEIKVSFDYFENGSHPQILILIKFK